MAGRPRSQARRIARLEKRAEELLKAFVYEHLPPMYRERIKSHDSRRNHPICVGWMKAWSGLTKGVGGLQALREVLEKRAESRESPPQCPFAATASVISPALRRPGNVEVH